MLLREQRDGHGLDLPDIGAVLADAAIGREVSRARRVEDRHACPSLDVAVGVIDVVLTFGISSNSTSCA